MYLLRFALCPNIWPILETKFSGLLRRMCVSQCLNMRSVLLLICDLMLLVCFCFIDRRAKYLAPREEFSIFPCCCCPECAFSSSCLECPLLFCYLPIPISPAYFLETLAKCTQMLPVMLGLAGLPILKINETNTSAPPFFVRIIHIVAHNDNSLNSILLCQFPFVLHSYILTGSLQFTILTRHTINSVVSLYESMCICSVYMELLS